MDKITQSEVEVPTDMLAGLLMEQASTSPAPTAETHRLIAKVYAVMTVTTVLTFATLATGYQYLFAYQLFA